MPLTFESVQRRVRRIRAYLSFFVVAGAQFLSPAAAADPSSRIDPPAWSYRHSKEELQAYGARATAQEPEKKSHSTIQEVRVRRMLREHGISS